MLILRILLVALPLSMSLDASAEEWKWQVRPYNKPGEVTLRGTHLEGFDTLAEAIEAVPEGARIVDIQLQGFLGAEKTRMQPEIHAYLQEHYPAKLKAALASAGNLHNPKVIALHGPFQEALLATSFVAELDKVLGTYGYKIAGISSEKFYISRREGEVSFVAMVWLRLESVGVAGGIH